MPPLADDIRAEILQQGPMTFRRFMELALYDPARGYYASGKAVVGRKGDFITNVSVGPLYGRLIARQVAEMWLRLGEPREFTIVEQGANDGTFARDLLAALRETRPDAAAAARYRIVEPFATLRERQRGMLGNVAQGAQIAWSGALAGMEPFEGVHFSNELVDAFPVHLVVFRGSRWLEKFVESEDGRFVFKEGPVSDPRLREHLAQAGGGFPDGYETEVNLAGGGWMRAVSDKLARGYVLTVDYGYPRDVYYQPERVAGTLACYERHRRAEDPLGAPGERDITAHVDFTGLAEAARDAGLDLAGFTDQHHFLMGLAADLLHPGRAGFEDAAELRQFKTLMHPEMMGTQFKAIAFRKNVPDAGALLGFQFGRDARAELWSEDSA